MKTLMVFLALLLGVVQNAVAGSGNVAAKDTVNGWYLWKADGSGLDTTYTYLTSKSYEGKSAQLFGNLAKNSETSYDWRKDLSKSYAFPKFVLAELYLESIKLESFEDSLNIADIEFYVGNKKNPTILYRMSRSGASYNELKWRFFESLPSIDSTIARPDSIDFVVIRLCYFGNTNPGAEFIVDYMRFAYGSPLKIGYDSSIVIDRFGDPDPVKLSPSFSVSSKKLDFDSTIVGYSKSLPLILGNPGNDTLVLVSVAETSNEFAVNPIPQRIRPSDSAVVSVAFKPNSSGLRNGYILFTHNAATRLDSVFVSGFGEVLRKPELSYSPRFADFGTLKINQVSYKDTLVTFRNTGSDTLRGNVSIIGKGFSMDDTMIQIVPMDSLVRTVRFAPSESGKVSGFLVITSNSPSSPDTVYLTGTAEKTTGVNDNQESPRVFSLSQNYPNPFNPTTKIRYEVPKSGLVRLAVYDALGREVKLLVQETKSAGIYETQFDASNLSSGTYFYRLIADNSVETKKMLLVK